MILEVGLFAIEPRRANEFAPVVSDIRAAFARGVEGLQFFELEPVIEDPNRWTVLAGWDALDDHERFVASNEGARQRELLAGFMLGEPDVFHLSVARIGAPAS